MSVIIVLTIGPVQSYISQARRTQDLWQGSRILSYLSGVGVYKAHDEAGWENVLYPRLAPHSSDQASEDDLYASIPNRMVVRWSGDEGGAKQCANAMKQAIEDAWRAISKNTFDYFVDTLDENKRQEVWRIWENQVNTWLECYWVVVSEDPQKLYSENIQSANAAMGVRKLLRNFPHIAEDGRKCSITGEHEALHASDDYVGFWNTCKAEQQNLSLLGKHERLSAISTIKRFAHEPKDNHELQFPNRFPSTSSIAAVPFKHAVLQALDSKDVETTHLKQKLQEFIRALLTLFKKPADLFFTQDGQNNPEYFQLIKQTISEGTFKDDLVQRFLSIDGDFLFEDTLISKTIEEYSGQTPNTRQMKNVKSALAELLKATSALKILHPQPYFVILSMDGDHMGKTLGTLQCATQHKTFSETLATFARKDVYRIVEEEHLGRVVYAGGDDVLALLPVQDALQVAEELRTAFRKKIADTGIKNHEEEAVTASTGLAYVHHTHNLQDAVQAANKVQKIAKDAYDRNALVVEFLRRSGEPRSMGHKWVLNDTNTFSHLDALIDAFDVGLSRHLPYDVAQIAYSMCSECVPDEARDAELKRIMRRRLPEDKQNLVEDLTRHVLALSALSELNSDVIERWHNAQRWLELARFIAQTT